MAGSTPPAVFNVIAQQLTNITLPTEEERIFHEALEKVKAGAKPESIPAGILALLNNAKSFHSLQIELQTARDQNRIWAGDKATSKILGLSNFIDKALVLKPAVDALVALNSKIAAPVWGGIVFILTILNEFSTTKFKLFERFHEILKKSLERFALYYERFDSVQGPVESAFRTYYEKLIEVFIGVTKELNRNTLRTVASILTQSLKKILDDYEPLIRDAVANVDVTANAQTANTQIKDGKNRDKLLNKIWQAQSGNTVVAAAPSVAATPTMTRSIAVTNAQWHNTATSSSRLRVLSGNAGSAGTRASSPHSRGRSISPTAGQNPDPGVGLGFTHGIPRIMSSHFQDQPEYISDISARLGPPMSSPSQQCVIYGMRGVGKTQILLHYAKSFGPRTSRNAANTYTNVFWVNGRDKTSVVNGFFSLALKLEIAGEVDKKDQEDVRQNLNRWFETHTCWLLIIDNVKDFGDIRDYVPPDYGGHILMSTQYRAIAVQFCSNPSPIEVRPMEIEVGTAFALSLAQDSDIRQDREHQVASDVAKFAKGMPLVIEQIIRNSICSQRPIVQTLRLLENRIELAQQETWSSLHEEKSVGVVIAQAIEDLGRKSPTAQALLHIFVHLDPSQIPYDLFEKNWDKFQTYMARSTTYDRGQVRSQQEAQEIRALRELPKASFPSSRFKFRGWTASTRRLRAWGQLKSEIELPLDNTTFDAQLRAACAEHTPIGRLFSSKEHLQDAFIHLKAAWIVRCIDNESLWMHDLYQDVGRAQLEIGNKENAQVRAHVAATTVYLALPIPEDGETPAKKKLCQALFPHAQACHRHLKHYGILNNSSLGPELSQIIASILLGRGDFISLEERREQRRRAKDFYREAIQGYWASWQRLKAMLGVDDASIVNATWMDFLFESRFRYTCTRFLQSHERFGRSAPWRMVQTAWKLVRLHTLDDDDMNHALPLAKFVHHSCQVFFGDLQYDTRDSAEQLYRIYAKLGRWQEAYDLVQKTSKAITLYDATTGKCAQKYRALQWDQEHGSYKEIEVDAAAVSEKEAIEWCSRAGEACLHLPGKAGAASRNFKQALMFTERMHGKYHFSCARPMHSIGLAQAQLGNLEQSLIWHAQAVFNRLDSLSIEYLDFDFGDPDYWRVWTDYDDEKEIVEAFEEAKRRLGDTSALPLDKFVGCAELRCNAWRKARAEDTLPPRPRDQEYTWAKVKEDMRLRLLNPSVDM